MFFGKNAFFSVVKNLIFTSQSSGIESGLIGTLVETFHLSTSYCIPSSKIPSILHDIMKLQLTAVDMAINVMLLNGI